MKYKAVQVAGQCQDQISTAPARDEQSLWICIFSSRGCICVLSPCHAVAHRVGLRQRAAFLAVPRCTIVSALSLLDMKGADVHDTCEGQHLPIQD